MIAMLRRAARWKSVRNPDGTTTLELRPAPKLRVITYAVVEEACGFLGISPQAVFAGDVDMQTLKLPTPDAMEGFLRAVLVNHEVFSGFRKWPIDRVEAVIAIVAANFLVASASHLRQPGPLGAAFSLN